jgi:hypothetical protein
MILEWGSEPQYINWEDGPKYVNVLLSDLAEHPDDYLLENANVKVVIDLQLSYEEVNYMKELFSSQYNIRELKMVPQKNEDLTNASETDIAFETVDQIVVDQITAMESEKYSTQTLLTIYRNLD